MFDAADLPGDVATLKAMLIAATAREAETAAQIARKDERIERVEKLVAAFKQAAFGRKSEKADPDQFDLALEDLETAMAAIQAEDEVDAGVAGGSRISKPRAANRGSLPKHLPVSKRSLSRTVWSVPAVVACIASARMSQSAWMWSRYSSASSSHAVPNMRAVPAPTVSFKLRLRHG